MCTLPAHPEPPCLLPSCMATPDLQHALDLIEQGRPTEAVPLLETVAAEMPTYVAALAVLARAHEAAEDWDAARDAWHRARFLMPNSPVIGEGLRRVAAATAPALDLDDEPDSLRMDLDLLTEFDATLAEALGDTFNPFTQPPPAVEPETDDEEDAAPMSVEAAQLGLANQALTATPEPPPEEPPEAEYITPTEAEQTAPREAEDTTADPARIYDEIDRLIAEKEQAESTLPQSTEEIQETTVRKALEQEARAAQEEPTAPADDEPLSAADAVVPPPGDDDLDRLISELEAARITPQPDLEDLPPVELDDDIEDIVSETLARIYAAQGQREEAARVYETLARQQPEQAAHFLDQAAALRAGPAPDDDTGEAG